MAVISILIIGIPKKPRFAKEEHYSRTDDYYDHDTRAAVCLSKLPAGAAGILLKVGEDNFQACSDMC